MAFRFCVGMSRVLVAFATTCFTVDIPFKVGLDGNAQVLCVGDIF